MTSPSPFHTSPLLPPFQPLSSVLPRAPPCLSIPTPLPPLFFFTPVPHFFFLSSLLSSLLHFTYLPSTYLSLSLQPSCLFFSFPPLLLSFSLFPLLRLVAISFFSHSPYLSFLFPLTSLLPSTPPTCSTTHNHHTHEHTHRALFPLLPSLRLTQGLSGPLPLLFKCNNAQRDLMMASVHRPLCVCVCVCELYSIMELFFLLFALFKDIISPLVNFLNLFLCCLINLSLFFSQFVHLPAFFCDPYPLFSFTFSVFYSQFDHIFKSFFSVSLGLSSFTLTCQYILFLSIFI